VTISTPYRRAMDRELKARGSSATLSLSLRTYPDSAECNLTLSRSPATPCRSSISTTNVSLWKNPGRGSAPAACASNRRVAHLCNLVVLALLRSQGIEIRLRRLFIFRVTAARNSLSSRP
jgi:hypothetical protein